jgi:hypothetical protein
MKTLVELRTGSKHNSRKEQRATASDNRVHRGGVLAPKPRSLVDATLKGGELYRSALVAIMHRKSSPDVTARIDFSVDARGDINRLSNYRRILAEDGRIAEKGKRSSGLKLPRLLRQRA